MPYCVEITGIDTSDGSTKTRIFGFGAGIAFSDHAYADSGAMKWSSQSQKIDVAREGGVALSGDDGSLQLSNLPADIQSAGPLDALAEWSWTNQRANLYWISDNTWANRFLVATSVLKQPVATIGAQGSTVSSVLTFGLADPRLALNVPLQPLKFLGTNSGGSGVEGEADIKGKVQPIFYGVVSNIPGVRVNQQKLIWKLRDVGGSTVTVLCVRDGAAGLTAGTARGSLASLQSNIPPAGKYDTYSGAEGLFVRVGSTPIYNLAFDAQEGTNAADRTHAQVWKRMRVERCGNVSGDIDAASVTAADTLDANEIGFYFDGDGDTRADMVNKVLTSFSGYEVQKFDLTWKIGKVVAPSGTTVLDFVLLTPASQLTSKSRPMTALNRARPNFAPDGMPPYRVNIQWGKNYTVMTESDFAGFAPQRLRDKFGAEFRTETATNNTIWNPTTSTGLWPNAPELTIETGYQPGVDNLTCPHAATEASRALALYSANKAQYSLSWSPAVTDRLLASDVVSAAYPQYGLSGGPLFMVLQTRVEVDETGASASALVGFQT